MAKDPLGLTGTRTIKQENKSAAPLPVFKTVCVRFSGDVVSQEKEAAANKLLELIEADREEM